MKNPEIPLGKMIIDVLDGHSAKRARQAIEFALKHLDSVSVVSAKELVQESHKIPESELAPQKSS